MRASTRGLLAQSPGPKGTNIPLDRSSAHMHGTDLPTCSRRRRPCNALPVFFIKRFSKNNPLVWLFLYNPIARSRSAMMALAIKSVSYLRAGNRSGGCRCPWGQGEVGQATSPCACPHRAS